MICKMTNDQEKIERLFADVSVIKDNLKSFKVWNRLVVGSLVSMFAVLLLALLNFSSSWGVLKNKVEINTDNIEKLTTCKTDKETIDYKFSIILEKINDIKNEGIKNSN